MTKSIEQIATEYAGEPHDENENRRHLVSSINDLIVSAAKSRDAQLMTVVNGLETLYYNNPNVRQDAYNQGVRDCIARLTKADQMLKEMKL